MKRIALGALPLLALGMACGGSGGGAGSSGGSTDGGPLLEGGALADGAVPADGGDAGACPAPPTVVLEANAGSLDVSGSEVVFMDHAAGVDFLSPTDKTKAIRKVKLDGTGDTVLHTAPAKHQINDVKTVGSTVFFLESERDTFGSEATSLFSVPIAGGAPVLIGKHADPNVIGDFDRLDAIIFADATSVFVSRGGPTGEDSLWRFAAVGGAESLVYRGAISTRPQKVGDQFFFASTAIPSGLQNFRSVVKVPAAGGALAAVGGAKCHSDLTAGAFGILCAGSGETATNRKLSRWDASGGAHQVLFSLPDSGALSVHIGPADDRSVHVTASARVGTAVNLWKAPLTAGPATIIACDRQQIPRRKTTAGSGSNGAYVSELDMAMTPTELVWTETRKEGADTKYRIYRTAR